MLIWPMHICDRVLMLFESRRTRGDVLAGTLLELDQLPIQDLYFTDWPDLSWLLAIPAEHLRMREESRFGPMFVLLK